MSYPGKSYLCATLLLAITWPTVGHPTNTFAQTSVYDGEELAAPEGFTTYAYDFPCNVSETVLLIQDVVPWFAAMDQHPDGAIVTELLARNKSFCVINSDDVGVTDLSSFKEIIIAAAQTQTFYANLFPGGDFHPDLTNWVQEGGVLLANVTDNASGPGAGGNWDGGVFIAGVQHVNSFVEDNDCVSETGLIDTDCSDVTHPIIAGQFGGDNGERIIDELIFGVRDDLDFWNFASHGYFVCPSCDDTLPPGTRVILTQPDVTGEGNPEPVMIQYPFGNGWVIATQTTTEWRYVGNFGGLPQNKKLLANLIGFQTALASFVRPMTELELFVGQLEFGDDWICKTDLMCDPDPEAPRFFQHGGVDVNPESSLEPVFAAAEGAAVLCGGQRGTVPGEFIVLEHDIAGAKLTTVYWHIIPVNEVRQLCPRPGTRRPLEPVALEKGSVIAVISPFGKPHLHFGIRLAKLDENVSQRGALPPEGTLNCMPCAAQNDRSLLPSFPSQFVDPRIFVRVDHR